MSANPAETTALAVYAPASIGNLSVGFDALGLALAPMSRTLLGDVVRLQPLDRETGNDWRLELTGPFAVDLPADPEDNIVIACCRAYRAAAAERGLTVEPLHVTLDKRLPIGSGLGSSASSIVATLEALNRWHGHPFNTLDNFRLMARREGQISGEIHLDNVAPCLFGGLRLCPPGSQREYALPWPGAWRAVVCWPGTKLVTREARMDLRPPSFLLWGRILWSCSFLLRPPINSCPSVNSETSGMEVPVIHRLLFGASHTEPESTSVHAGSDQRAPEALSRIIEVINPGLT